MVAATKLAVTTNPDAMKMADTIFGDGIKIVSASYSGDPNSAGLYSGADTTTPGFAPSDSGLILSTGRASDITNAKGQSNQTASRSTDTKGTDNDADLNAVAGAKTFDAAIFKAEFIPTGSELTMQITFSSEEYLEYVGSGFNDAVGVWVNGQPATLTVGNGDVSIDNINPTSNSNLYIDNADDSYNTEMDGFTVTLTLKAPVIPGQINTIKIGIADAGDASYDSNLMIAGNSIQTAVVASADAFEIGLSDSQVVDLTANDTNTSGGALTITEINGQPVVAGSVVTLNSGMQITVNADGTITVVSDPSDTPGTETFTYEVTNAAGITDVGLVQGTLIPCFVAGTRIDTALGPIAVEQIRVGDLVETLDDGYQPVLWCGARRVRSQGRMAAVTIPAGMFGDHAQVRVSPQHRLYLAGWRAQLYCGTPEVLVKAVHLVRAGLLAQDHTGTEISYHHLLFDRHQIICAEGLWSESYLPGPQTLPGHDADTQAELLALFPMLLHYACAGYGPAARPQATAGEAALLV
jgi:hypothetical protein